MINKISLIQKFLISSKNKFLLIHILMTDYTDELFALRLTLQDSIFDESRIIRELKLFLLDRNEPPESIDSIIVEFYKKYFERITL